MKTINKIFILKYDTKLFKWSINSDTLVGWNKTQDLLVLVLFTEFLLLQQRISYISFTIATRIGKKQNKNQLYNTVPIKITHSFMMFNLLLLQSNRYQQKIT